MINFSEEINNYKTVTKFSNQTMQRYSTVLLDFCKYLSSKLNCSPSEVMLDKIYTIRTPDKSIVGYKPIDTSIVDTYILMHVDEGYSIFSSKAFALRSFFKFLRKNRNFPDIISNSKIKVSHYKPNCKTVRVLSRHEFLRFLQSLIQNSDDFILDLLLFSLLFTTGCRISEILTLTKSDIDIDEEMIFLRKTKTKVQRIVVLRKGFGQAIKEYLINYSNTNSSYLFSKEQNENNSQPMTRADVDKLFKKYLLGANLPPMRIHSIRHSFATFMRNSGIDLFTIMDLLGHERLRSTLGYTEAHYNRNQNVKIKQNDEVYRHLRSVLTTKKDSKV